MAKINGVLIPKASGSIGNITFRTSGRETVASEKITNNSSNTKAQQNQRILFKDRMREINKIKILAPYLYTKKGFKTAYSKLSSVGLSMTENDFNRYADNGLNFADAALAVDQPIVDGEVTAYKVEVSATGDMLVMYIPYNGFEPRKNYPLYGITSAVSLYCNANNAEDSSLLVKVLNTEEQAVISEEEQYLRVAITGMQENWREQGEGKPLFWNCCIPSIRINGKRVRLDSTTQWERLSA